jgi:N-acetylmuramoyl-L-alanine amidase
MAVPGKLKVDTATGHVTGPASITYNDPWPCSNGSWGSGAMMGVVMHTQVGNNPGTVAWFNNPQAQASAHFCIAQDGSVVQMGPIGQGWIAWAQAEGNAAWYSIEHADDGYPANPLTSQQVTASAQLLECLSAFAGFPLQVSNSVSQQGYGWHGMGGAAWGGHLGCPGDVRKAQRAQIVSLAQAIRSGTPAAAAAPAVQQVTTEGADSLAVLAASRKSTPAAVLQLTAQHGYAPATAAWLNDVFAGKTAPANPVPKGVTLWLPS